MAKTFRDVTKNAKYYLFHANEYTYCLGGQGEPLSELGDKIKYYYGMTVEQFCTKYGVKKTQKGIDCSGLVNLCAGKSRSTVSAAYGKMCNTTPTEGTEGNVLWFEGHVGVDIGGGYFIHTPCEGHTVELGHINTYGKWLKSGNITGIDYTGASAE